MEDLFVGAPKNLRATEIMTGVQRAATPYMDRMSSYDLDYRFHTTPLSIPAKRNFLRPLSESLIHALRPKFPESRLKNLPNEIVLNIVRFLDIASLAKFAASNFGLRCLVIGMPHVQIVKSHATTSLALSRMLHAGTAKHFTLEDFVGEITTSTCSTCNDRDTFAPWLCLVLCRRICGKCIRVDQKTIRLPQDMAIKCFGLDLEDMADRPGTASAILQTAPILSEKKFRLGSRSLALMQRDHNVDIVSLRSALKLSLKRHARAGGPSHVKKLVKQYIEEHYPKTDSSDRWTVITDDCKVSGLSDVIEKEWKNQVPDQDWVLTAYVPFLYSATFPLRFETGLSCEGCERNISYAESILAHAAAATAAEKAYLPAQYEAHYGQCDMAQSISRGDRLKMSNERELKESMSQAISRFRFGDPRSNDFLNTIQQVNFDRTPTEVIRAVSRALQRIHDVGNKSIQQRTSASWQTASAASRQVQKPA
jgi:hypothetical protein